MKSWLILLVAVVAFAAAGCDDSESVEQVEWTPEDNLRQTLEQVAEQGQAGSALGPLMSYVNALKETNPTLAAELEPAAKELMETRDPDAAKAKAKEMLAKLGEGAAPATE